MRDPLVAALDKIAGDWIRRKAADRHQEAAKRDQQQEQDQDNREPEGG
jgi:hypothetical protein